MSKGPILSVSGRPRYTVGSRQAAISAWTRSTLAPSARATSHLISVDSGIRRDPTVPTQGKDHTGCVGGDQTNMGVSVSRAFIVPSALHDELVNRASKKNMSVDELVVKYLGGALEREDREERRSRDLALIRSLRSPRIKLSADYGAPPIWDADKGGPFPWETLPLSPALHDRLDRWRISYSTYYEREGKHLEQQTHSVELGTFEQEGLALWQLLREELAGQYSVIYRSSTSGDLVVHPDDVIGTTQPLQRHDPST